MEFQTNLRKLCKGRKKRPVPGDMFAFTPFEDRYLVGRVVIANAAPECAPMPGANLIYLYGIQFTDRPPELTKLTVFNLLVPPIWTNNLGWTKGYFETFSNAPIQSSDLLPKPCFYHVPLRQGAPGWYVNQIGERVDRRSEPCGSWALASYRWIDDRVSDALSITRVPA